MTKTWTFDKFVLNSVVSKCVKKRGPSLGKFLSLICYNSDTIILPYLVFAMKYETSDIDEIVNFR